MTLDEIKPFGDRLLVRPDPKLATSEGGLHIPETVLSDNPNFYTMSGVVVKLGDGIYEDTWECLNPLCKYQARRTAGEYCPVCKGTQKLVDADGERKPFDVAVWDRVLFGRFAGKQIEVEQSYHDQLRAELNAMPDEQSRAHHVMSMSSTQRAILNWGDSYDPSRRDRREKLLLMREIEVLGILGDETVLPGYSAPTIRKATAGLTQTEPVRPR